MKIPEEIKANHEELSPIGRQFLEFVEANPECAVKKNFFDVDIDPILTKLKYTVNAWPVFLGEDKLRELWNAVIEVPKLIKTIPKRFFDNNPKKFAAYYGIEHEFIAQLLLAPPNGIEAAFCRCDFINAERGFLCLEANIDSHLGGWEHPLWERVFRDNPLLARFEKMVEKPFICRSPVRSALIHVVGDAIRRKMVEGGRLNLAVAVPAREIGRVARLFEQAYREVLQEAQPGLTGTVVGCSYPDGLQERESRLFHGDTPIHMVLECTNEPTPNLIYRMVKARKVLQYNTPVNYYLSDKRNLALLSAHQDGPLFKDEERALIQAHIPWSRELKPGRTDFRGSAFRMPEDLIAEKDLFIIKKGQSYQGDDVFVGRSTPMDEWRAHVENALRDGTWLAQEFVRSLAYAGQWGDEGWAEQDFVWGMFGYGDMYGGGFLRMMPRGQGDDVINTARGATDGFIYEVP